MRFVCSPSTRSILIPSCPRKTMSPFRTASESHFRQAWGILTTIRHNHASDVEAMLGRCRFRNVFFLAHLSVSPPLARPFAIPRHGADRHDVVVSVCRNLDETEALKGLIAWVKWNSGKRRSPGGPRTARPI